MATRYIVPMGRPIKEERNRLLREYYANHPYLTLAQVGEIFNISRQRVQIILKEGAGEVDDGKD